MLKDKVALVTRGTSGIGRATALAFAQRSVGAASRREGKLNEVIAYTQQQAKVVVGRRIDEGEETVKNTKTEHCFPATHNRSIPYDPA